MDTMAQEVQDDVSILNMAEIKQFRASLQWSSLAMEKSYHGLSPLN